MLIRIIKVSVLFVVFYFGNFLYAQTMDFVGAEASRPATNYQEAMLNGNGTIGGIVFGNPYNETIILTHCRLFATKGSREIVPDGASFMPELKNASLKAGKDGPAVAHKMFREKTGHRLVHTDPFHPGFFLRINMKEGAAENYRLTENFQTGEIVVNWSDSDGNWQRKFFVSRADNIAVLSIKGPKGKVNLDLEMEIEHPLVETSIESKNGIVTAHTVYTKGKGGYDSVLRIAAENGKVTDRPKGASVSNADEVVLLMQLKDWRTPLSGEISEAWAYSPENPYFHQKGYKTNYISDMVKELTALEADYDKLLRPHVKLHGDLYSRVKLDLKASPKDRRKTSEELLKEAFENDRMSPALMERMYDGCRYLTICSAGQTPPNLQGIWTGTWRPAWSGDYTLDSNLQLEVQSIMSCNMVELMESYFDLVDSWLPDCRLNAKRMYGCRGAVSNARASSACLLIHWGKWPGEQLISCLGWLAHFYYDYYQFTGDREFLKNRAVPLLKEIALFYEDLLKDTEDENGKFRFYISYSPEHQLWANSTFDISVAKAVYTYLIKSCQELEIEKDKIQKWNSILSKMPPYLVNSEGGLKEWAWEGVGEDFNQRHHSHFLPLYQFCEFDPDKTPELWQASHIAFNGKVDGWLRRKKGSNSNHITHGMVNQGQCAARLGRGDIVYEVLSRLATRKYLFPSFMMSYWPGNKGFGFDPIGTIPDVVNNSLVFMWEKTLDVLPALPKQWPEGSIQGVLLRDQVKLNSLRWKESGRDIQMSLTSKVNQSITLRLPKGNKIKFVKVLKGNGQIYKVSGRDNCAKLDLPADEEVQVKIVSYVN